MEEFKKGMRVVALEGCAGYFLKGVKGTIASVDSKDIDGTILVKWDDGEDVLNMDGNTDWWIAIENVAILNNEE